MKMSATRHGVDSKFQACVNFYFLNTLCKSSIPPENLVITQISTEQKFNTLLIHYGTTGKGPKR